MWQSYVHDTHDRRQSKSFAVAFVAVTVFAFVFDHVES